MTSTENSYNFWCYQPSASRRELQVARVVGPHPLYITPPITQLPLAEIASILASISPSEVPRGLAQEPPLECHYQ